MKTLFNRPMAAAILATTAGLCLMMVHYTVAGDEGGTWTSCGRVERLNKEPLAPAETRQPGAMPRTFAARIGGMPGSTIRVELIEGALVYSTMRGRKTGDQVKIRPSPDQWREFRAALDELNVWRWEPSYMNRKVFEGTHWSLEIAYADRTLKTAGSNSYPDDTGKPTGKPRTSPAFSRYLAAVEKLLGGRTFK